ncbi:MAG: SDR family oxidoreductase [Acetobacteraceae bacterium]|nr:SDR family oxidoreductase [Acetobacteraceae bacterium]
MDLQLRGCRALVTGGSKGIGRAAAMSLAAEGCALVLAARTASVLDETAEAIRARHQIEVRTVPADLSTEEACRAVAKTAGDVDILVNNAGAIPPGDLVTVSDATWRAAWDLKVFGFISLSRAIYAAMAARRSGVIVNVIGAAGEQFPPGYIVGATGNAALMAFTRALGRAAPAQGVRVVGINPGPVETERAEMLARAAATAEGRDPERWRDRNASMPFGRAAKPEEIGDAVAFLASPRSGYTSGTVLTINGGG